MTDSKKTKPSHIAFITREYSDGEETKTRFLEIGALWPHKDGKGFNLILDAVPVGGKIVLRANEPRTSEGTPAHDY